MKTTYNYDHYYDWQEMTTCLKELAEKYPTFMKLESICVSEEGKDVWAITLSDGEAANKPAYYIDGNHHAGEVTGAMSALHFIDVLCTNEDHTYDSLLKKYTFYIIPKISPDGSDAYLNSAEKLRSVNRPYPFVEKADGLHPQDLDGDGVIRMMRVKTPYGAWKVSKSDPRAMAKRTPNDVCGEFYNVFPEGEIVNYDGLNVYLAKNKWGLDFNRNYPFGWFSEVRQGGAGKYPLSNLENKAVADFVLNHKNIGFVATLHTTGGVLVYPPGTYPEADALQEDMALYKNVGKIAKEIMGYETVNIFDGFLTDIVNYSSGAFDDWCYETQGIPAYTVELWNMMERAGADMSWPRRDKCDDQKEAEFVKAIHWIDENVGPEGFKNWTTFNHPQLGEVEIGGFDFKFTVQNPPNNFLLQEVEKTTKFMIQNTLVLPCLKIEKTEVISLAENLYQVKAVVANTGYMPTYCTQSMLKQKIDKPVNCELIGNVTIIKDADEVKSLQGISGIATHYGYDGIDTEESESQFKAIEWIIKVEKGSSCLIKISNEKAGTDEKTIILN